MAKDWIQYVNKEGELTEGKEIALERTECLALYELMVTCRVFEHKATVLQRQGFLGTYASGLGQEAAQVGSASVLQKNDWLFPYGRDLGAAIVAGIPIDSVFLWLMGHQERWLTPSDIHVHVVPPAVEVASQIPHAVGVAWSTKLRREPQISLCYFGDGATSKGDFHEAVNMAAVFQVPVVFFCENNQWAISTPFARQTAVESIADKASAYGLPSFRIDGNDVLAVYQTVKDVTEKMRETYQPVLIEAVTYRLDAHTTADDPRRYRTDDEVDRWRQLDPLIRAKSYLIRYHQWSESEDDALINKIRKRVDDAWQRANDKPPSRLASVFHHVFYSQTTDLKQQESEVQQDG
ncbi:MAG: pyruvate dehydrogenase (acetyl-transferring) E1 component subunit alpha [Sulfobacillus acidophilus]|uniref:2-oxoisovalerate dehydrogenase subunit alpha n=1 Tax=Sulfobacillus acidophilus TaxID=53633 RepID=A0A2T2WNF3_9FIRM|nr:MAG: pyruvate dehydrogenase (acetyl-transferring) E1 component subunit alpha [Sulfobacillus acidophilus]